MSLIISFLKGMTLGTIVFVAIPLVSKAAPRDYHRQVLDAYQSMAMNVLGRALLIVREHGGLLLKGTVFDTRFAGERCTISGEKKHWKDPSNKMATFQGKPFGIALEKFDVIVDARTSHFGRLFRQLKQTGRWEVEGLKCAYFTVPENKTILVNPNDVTPILQGRASPGLADRLETFVEKGQSGFNSSQTIQYIQWLIGLGAGMGLMMLASRVIEQSGGGGSAVIPV